MLGLSVFALVILVLAVGTLKRPAVAFAGVICLYGLKQWGQSMTPLFCAHREVANFAIGLIAVMGLGLAAWRRGCILCRLPPVAYLVGLLYVYALASLAWAPDMAASLEQWSLAGPYIVLVTFTAPLLVREVGDVRSGFEWIAAVGGALCLLMLLFGTWSERGLQLYGDLSDTQTNPLALASLGGTVAIVSSISLLGRGRLLKRIFLGAFFPIGLALVLRTGSRGQLLALMPALLVAWPIASNLRDTRSVLALLVGLLAVAGLAWWASTLVAIDSARWATGQSEQDVLGRVDMATTLLHAASSSVMTTIFGLGNSSSFQIIGFYPHITALEVLAEEGMLGAGVYASIIFLALKSVLRVMARIREDYAARRTLAMLTAAFVFELILTWKEGTLLSSVYAFAYAVMLGRLDYSGIEVAGTTGPDTVRPEPVEAVYFENLMQ